MCYKNTTRKRKALIWHHSCFAQSWVQRFNRNLFVRFHQFSIHWLRCSGKKSMGKRWRYNEMQRKQSCSKLKFYRNHLCLWKLKYGHRLSKRRVNRHQAGHLQIRLLRKYWRLNLTLRPRKMSLDSPESPTNFPKSTKSRFSGSRVRGIALQ